MSMNISPKLLVVGVLATALGAFSAPALASYAHVTAYGTGANYQAALSWANQSAALACAQQGGSLVSTSVFMSYQYLTGGWDVGVGGTCFIYP